MSFDHVWHWRRWLGERKGQRCRVVAVGRMNAALVEFDDGLQVITSRYAVRKAPVSREKESYDACAR